MLAAVVTTISCSSRSGKKTKSDGLTGFREMKYAKLFGIARFGDHEQLFYLSGKDTTWSLSSSDLPREGQKLAVLSSVFAGFIEEFGMQENIVAVDHTPYYSDSTVLARIAGGQTLAVGEEGQLQVEKLIALKPHVVVASSFGFTNTSLKTRLANLNIQLLLCDNFKELHPLARAEWVKFFGFLLNRSNEADSLFNLIERRYEDTRRQGANVKEKPMVMTDAMYQEVWNVPGGNSYTQKLIEDAGGQYVFREKQGLHTYPLNLESVLKSCENADVWINVNQFHSKAEMLRAESRYALFGPFKGNRIYNNNKRENKLGGNDFWEKGVVRPDLVLKDLQLIFSDPKISSDKLYFYTHLD